MVNQVNTIRSIFLAIALFIPVGVNTQTPSTEWRWTFSGNVFAGVNHQNRKFRDFTAFEAQNWAMGMGERPLGPGRLTLDTMLSLEAFTLKKIGSAQVFQAGETFNNAQLIDYQHPHDLFMTLQAVYARPAGPWTLKTSGAVVGQPALGPPPFMHRPSAVENPQSPLAHHHLDSIHVTPGVLTVGLFRQGYGIETSWFHGREPDEDRTDIDFGPLDSWSVRGSWTRGPWSAQLSGGRSNEPDVLNPGDMTRLMASVAHTRTGAIPTAVMIAWGQNRESHGTSNGVLLETNMSWLERNHLYSRIELVGRELPHIHGGSLQPSHMLMNVGAFTGGYTRDLLVGGFGRIGVGGDATMYYVPRELQESYGAPLSFHLFVRYRFNTAATDVEHHH